MHTHSENSSKFSPGFVALVAVLLVFVLTLVFIWLWYDVKIHALENEKAATHSKP